MFISDDEIWELKNSLFKRYNFPNHQDTGFDIKSFAFKVGYTKIKHILNKTNKNVGAKSRNLCNLLWLENYFPEISLRIIASILTGARNFYQYLMWTIRISKNPRTLIFNYKTYDGYSFLWRTALFNELIRQVKVWRRKIRNTKNTKNLLIWSAQHMFLSSLHHLVLFRCTIARYIKGGFHQSGSGESVLDVLVQNPRRSIWRAGHIWWADTRKDHPPDGVCRRENDSLQSADHGRPKPG